MNIEEFNTKPLDEVVKEFEEILAELKTLDIDNEYWNNVQRWIDEYEMDHDIFDRPDKVIGDEKSTKTVETAKLGVPFQKKVVNSSVSFLFGEPVKLVLNNEEEKYLEAYALVKDVWKQAKLDYHNRRLARKLFVETRAAELYYVRKDDEGEKKVKVMILCKSNGDEITPHWDELGDFDALIREYQWADEDKKMRHKVEIYTAAFNYICIKKDEWQVARFDNLIKKIPIIYYEIEHNDWEDVQSLIDRVEIMISKNADTNDYFGSPAIVSKGQLKNAPEKGEIGKFFEILGETSEGTITYGDLTYLTWDQMPEAIKLEYDILKDLVHSMTQTPDLSFQNVKGTSSVSGITLKFMFLDSMMKAKNHEEIFGEGLERRVNLIKQIITKVLSVKQKFVKDLDIEVEFQDGLPENVAEIIEMLTNAVAGESVMSQESAVKRNPMIDNPEDEVAAMKVEKEENTPPIPESFG